MKKVVRFLVSLCGYSLLFGFFISCAEKKRERKDRGTEVEEKERHRPYGPYEAHLKRPLDFATALMALLFLSPVYLVLAILVRIKLGKPVLFTQERPGKYGKIFKLYKFRSMTDERDEKGVLLPDEKRLTEFGKRLRLTSLDELPELFNILKGEMSLVGPRPLLVEYLPYYNEVEKHRHDVRPGLTGLAQVSGRNMLNWKERFAIDVNYAENISFILDLKIIILTIKKVLSHSDILEDTSRAEPNLAKERKEEMNNV